MKLSPSFVASAAVAVTIVACSSSSSDPNPASDASTPDTSVADTSVADTSVADTSVADTSIADAGPTAFGCDTVFDGGGHTCTDKVFTNIPTGLFNTAKSQCMVIKGSVVAACDHTGSVGGCTMTEMSNGITSVTTTWQYPPQTVSSTMTLCTSQAGNTYVAP